MASRKKKSWHPSEVDIAVHVHDARWKTLLRPYCKTVRAACEAALAAAQSSSLIRHPSSVCELAVVLAGDAFIRELNATYRGKNKPTNVLSFPNPDAAAMPHPALLALSIAPALSREASPV